MANHSWCSQFPGYKIINGDPKHFDHRPIVVQVDGASRRWRARDHGVNKRFEARWLMEEDCEKVVEEAWEKAGVTGNAAVMDGLRIVSQDLHQWSRDVLGDLQQRIKKLKLKLEECRLRPVTQANIAKEQVVWFKRERLEDQFELLF